MGGPTRSGMAVRRSQTSRKYQIRHGVISVSVFAAVCVLLVAAMSWCVQLAAYAFPATYWPQLVNSVPHHEDNYLYS